MKNKTKSKIEKIYLSIKTSTQQIIRIFGIDRKKIASIRHISRYLSDSKEFKRLGGSVSRRYPILDDYMEQAGSGKGHYFHQDLLIATNIYENNPKRHIDIGSRIDGFVAHVAAFRSIEIMDVRQLEETGHENIRFIQADLIDERNAPESITDSISCLHAIEHFGLGRYGDPIDPKGHLRGFNNILKMLEKNGLLYISFPIGLKNEVHFNAHRIFHPNDIFTWATQPNTIKLLRFDYVDDQGNIHKQYPLNENVPLVAFGCGIYTFQKI